MSFHRLRDFAGRQAEIAAFDSILAGDEKIALLIDGFSGTGKSTLAEWLRRNRCAGLPSAVVRLRPELAAHSMFAEIVEALSPDQAEGFHAEMETILASDKPINVTYSPTQTIEATWKGEVRGTSQTAGDVHLHMDQLTASREHGHTYRMLRAVTRALDHLTGRWLLFFDETEHLDEPMLGRLVLGQLLSTLRRRFPEARFVFTGQRIPIAAFEPHEYVRSTLDVFDRATAYRLMEKVGVREQVLQERAYQLTGGGHPLLLAMWFETGMAGLREPPVLIHAMSARTQWIYQRVIERLPAGVSRKIAADLALFEWFDVELLRQVFEVDLTEAEFRQLADRAFVKPLSNGRWTCHDIVRLHLPPERRQLDLQAFRAVHVATLIVLRERLATLPAFFSGRLHYVGAVLHSLQEIDPDQACLEARRELGVAFVHRRLEDAFGIARQVRQTKFAPWGPQLAQRVESALSYATSESGSVDYALFLEELGAAAEYPPIADALFFYAGNIALEVGDMETAARLAVRGLELYDDVANYSLNAEVLAALGKSELAVECLRAARERHGDLAQFALTEVAILQRSGDEAGVWQKLTETVTAFPTDVPARRTMAWRALSRDLVGVARAQVDALKKLGPTDQTTTWLEVALLEKEGRLREAYALVNAERDLSPAEDDWVELLQMARDPVVAASIESSLLALDGEVNFGEACSLLMTTGLAGQVERTERIIEATLKRWPEYVEIAVFHRATAYAQAGRLKEAVLQLEPTVLAGTSTGEAALLLVKLLGILGETSRQRAALSRVSPRFRDLAFSTAATLAAQAGQATAALDTLRSHEAGGRLGPFSLFARANILAMLNLLDDAVESLDTLLNTYSVSDAPRLLLINAHSVLGTLLAKKGLVEPAREVAGRLVRFSKDSEASLQAQLAIHIALKDVGAMRDLLNGAERYPGVRAMTIFALGAAIAEAIPSIPHLMEELRRAPDRVEIVVAIDHIVSRGLPANIAPVLAEIHSIAPGVAFVVEDLRTTVLSSFGASAIEQISEALRTDPDNVMLRVSMILLLLHAKRLEEATEWLGEIDGAPILLRDSTRARVAREYILAGRLTEAVVVLADTLHAEDPSPFLCEMAAMLLHQLRDGERLAQLYERRLRHAGDLRAAVLSEAIRFLAPFDRAKANDYLDELGRLTSSSADNSLSYGQALRAIGRFSDALVALERIATEHGTIAEVEDEIGRCHQALGEHARAIPHLQKAAELNPRTAYHYTALSESLEAEGRREEAYATLRIAVAIDPDLFADCEDRLRLLMPAKAIAAFPAPTNFAGG